MKSLLAGLAALILLLAAYLLAWPVPVDPIAWVSPPDRGLVDDFEANDRLAPAYALSLGDHEGPEDLTAGADGNLYATTLAGDILRVSPSGTQVSVFASPGGRPLGIDTAADGSLVVANAIKGIQRIAMDGTVETLLDTVDDVPLVYANDVAVAEDGTIYFSESTSKFAAEVHGGTLAASLLDILEHGCHGRVFEFDPASGDVEVVVDGLCFANGVAISRDQADLLIAETANYRVLRHRLEGENAGTTEVVLDNLPGFPDNIDNGLHDRYWVGLVAPRNRFLDRTAAIPWLRKVAQRLPAALRPKPERASHVIAITADGLVLMNLQDPSARFPLLTGVLETPATLYLTTLVGNKLPRLDKQDLL